MSDGTAERVFDLAARLRHQFGSSDDRVSFTHVPCVVAPDVALELLRESALSQLVPPDGQLLNHPERPWYTPIVPIHADPDALQDVTVTASTWENHPYQGQAAELEIRLHFGAPAARAYEGFFLWSSQKSTLLGRRLYDAQRSETGYEGDEHLSSEPASGQTEDFIRIVRRLVGLI